MTNDTRNLISFDTLLIANVMDIKLVGSRVTCSQYSDEAEYDHLVLCESLDHTVTIFQREGFATNSSLEIKYAGVPDFVSMRRGMMNLLITEEQQFFDKFMLATHVAKSLDVLDKQHRICLFQAILYGNTYQIPSHALDTDQAE